MRQWKRFNTLKKKKIKTKLITESCEQSVFGFIKNDCFVYYFLFKRMMMSSFPVLTYKTKKQKLSDAKKMLKGM